MSDQWREPAFRAAADAWIGGQLGRLGIERTGPIEQPHVLPWSTVLRIPTDSGDVWFKANDEALRQEAALAAFLAERRPDLVPPLLAADPESGWMLMADAGESLRVVAPRERSLDRWFDVLPRYAELQLAVAADVDRLLELGAPDRRLALLPEQYRELVSEVDVEPRFREAATVVDELCDRLAEFGIAETIQHDDLHDAQVFVRDGHQLLLDWGDACVSHPFFTLSVTLEGVLSWGLDDVEDSVDTVPFRDAYLAPYAEAYDVDLVAATAVSTRLGWASRAVNGHFPGDDDSTRARLRMFLDGRA